MGTKGCNTQHTLFNRIVELEEQNGKLRSQVDSADAHLQRVADQRDRLKDSIESALMYIINPDLADIAAMGRVLCKALTSLNKRGTG